jgi:hypothetical protein
MNAIRTRINTLSLGFAIAVGTTLSALMFTGFQYVLILIFAA